MCKATEGVGYQDPKFDRDIPLIQASGMIPGAYHFLRDGDGAAQARAFLTRVAQYGGPDGWLIQLDCESDGYGPEMTAWAAEWNRLTGNHPFLIYSGAWWWPRTNGFRGVDLTPHVWHSHYVPGTGYGSTLYEQVPASGWKPGYGGWNEATILQFSDAGRVAGARLDVNAFRGTVEQLRALARTPIAPKPSPPARSWTKELIMELPVLRRGAKGSQVTVLQGLLNARGQKLAEDGDYGPRTEAAVKAEQREGHIGVDGVAGQHTYSVLLLGRDIF